MICVQPMEHITTGKCQGYHQLHTHNTALVRRQDGAAFAEYLVGGPHRLGLPFLRLYSNVLQRLQMQEKTLEFICIWLWLKPFK